MNTIVCIAPVAGAVIPMTAATFLLKSKNPVPVAGVVTNQIEFSLAMALEEAGLEIVAPAQGGESPAKIFMLERRMECGPGSYLVRRDEVEMPPGEATETPPPQIFRVRRMRSEEDMKGRMMVPEGTLIVGALQAVRAFCRITQTVAPEYAPAADAWQYSIKRSLPIIGKMRKAGLTSPFIMSEAYATAQRNGLAAIEAAIEKLEPEFRPGMVNELVSIAEMLISSFSREVSMIDGEPHHPLVKSDDDTGFMAFRPEALKSQWDSGIKTVRPGTIIRVA